MLKKLSKTKTSRSFERTGSRLSGINLFLWLFIVAGIPASTQAQDSVQHQTLQEQLIRAGQPPIHARFNMSSISYPVIQNARGSGSVNNLLDMMPSMVTTSDAGTGIGYTYMRVRGIDQTRINVTLNDITINDAESQGAWLTDLPDMGAYIGQVEVQRGGHTPAGSTSYGARIDFITRDISETPFAEMRSSLGSFRTFSNAVSAGTGLLGKRFSATVSFSDIRSDGYIDRAEAKLNAGFLSAQCRLLNFKKHKDYGTLKFNLLHGSEHTGLAWDGVPADSLKTNRTCNSNGEYWTDNGERRYYADNKDHYKQAHYQLAYVKSFRNDDLSHQGKLTLTAHLTRGIGYYQEYKDDRNPSEYGLVALCDSVGTCDLIVQQWLDNYYYGLHSEYADSWKLKKRESQWIKWAIGADVDNYDGLHHGDVIRAQPARVQDFACDYQWYRGTGNKFQTKIFGNIEYIIRHFSIDGELQYRFLCHDIGGTDYRMENIDQQYQWNFINPKTTLCYYWGNKYRQSVNISFSMANREPTRSDIVNALTDEKPIPETLYDLETGYQIGSDKFNLDINLYGMYYRDQLVLTGEINDVGAAIMTNVDRSYRVGVEIAAACRPVRFFTWHINGCLSRNRILDFTQYVDNWDNGGQIVEHRGNTPISFSPAVVLANNFKFTPIKDFDIDLLTKFVSRQYLDNSANEIHILKPYSYTNLRISYTFHFKSLKELGLFFEINNIFNAQYESNAWIYSYYCENVYRADAAYYPQAGINFLGGIRLKF